VNKTLVDVFVIVSILIAAIFGSLPTVLNKKLGLLSAYAGSNQAQYRLAHRYISSRGGTTADAVKWYRAAGEDGHAESQFQLGMIYSTDVDESDFPKKDFAKAVLWLQKAADQEHLEAQNRLGELYEDGNGVEKDIAMAAQWYRRAAEQGSASAKFNLGVLFYVGDGVVKDFSETIRLFRDAADQGHFVASMRLGWMYDNGKGVDKDLAEAAGWYRKGIDLAEAARTRFYGYNWDAYEINDFHRESAIRLAEMYAKGEGVPKDLKQAVELAETASFQANAEIKIRVGQIFAKAEQFFRAAHSYSSAAWDGHPSAPLIDQIIEWHQKAAERGEVFSMTSLAEIYEKGEWVEKDIIKTAQWYVQAIEHRDNGARRYLEDLLPSLIKIAEEGRSDAQKLLDQVVALYRKLGDDQAQAIIDRHAKKERD
jgi:uncharacterized protein